MVPKLPVVVLLVGLAGTGYGLIQQVSIQRQINQQTILVAQALTQTHGLLGESNTRLSQLSRMDNYVKSDQWSSRCHDWRFGSGKSCYGHLIK
jgi:hypothetical protein